MICSDVIKLAKFGNQSDYFASPILLSFLLPSLIGMIAPESAYSFIMMVFFLLLWTVPVTVVALIVIDFHCNGQPIITSIFKRLVFLPPGLAFKSDVKLKKVPVAIVTIILVNILVYFVIPENVADGLIFFPYGDPSSFRVIVSFFTSAFLHADSTHLTNYTIIKGVGKMATYI